MRRGPSIRYLLLIANAFIVLLPIGAVVFLRLWDTHLVRVNEEQLISRSVLLASAWRAQQAPAATTSPAVPDRIEPVLAEGYDILPPADAEPPERHESAPAGAADGSLIADLLAEERRLNSTRARILDTRGCVIVSSEGDRGACFPDAPEVTRALTGAYAAGARRHIDEIDDDTPLTRPHGNVRVFTATPILAAGRVIGVVYLARTSSSPLEAVWTLRHTLALALALCVLLMAAVTFFLSRAISRPVLTITTAAEAVARGEPPSSFDVEGLVPAEVEALSRSLQRMTAQLTDRSRYILDFAANVSHELKTPLAGIRGAVELLREQWEVMSEEERRRFLDNIDADVSRTQRLVTRLLQLARIQSSPEHAERVALPPFFRHLAERYDGRVVVDLSASPEAIEVNPDHLETAVHNLVDNAVRHGGDTPVDVSVHERDGKLVVRVRDHGHGISERNRGRIFDRFFTTERDRGGTGLGLAIVRAVAETRGGSVTFETGHDGTTFVLEVGLRARTGSGSSPPAP